MSREERKLRKAMQERAKREFKKSRKFQGREQRGGSRPTLAGMIAEIGPGYCDILKDRDRIRCRGFSELAIGDQVLYSLERRRVEEILPRRAALSRSDPHNPHLERVIAANVDIVVNVVALKSPPLRPGLIDRYLIATGKSGANPLLCVNKIDLLSGDEELESLQPYPGARPGRRYRGSPDRPVRQDCPDQRPCDTNRQLA